MLNAEVSRRKEWGGDAELAFEHHKKAFLNAPILLYLRLQQLIILQTNTSRIAKAIIVKHYHRLRILPAVNSVLEKCYRAEASDTHSLASYCRISI